IFEHAAPLEIGPERLLLAYESSSFLAKQAEEPAARQLLADAARAHFGREVAVELDLDGRHREVQTLAAINSAEQQARLEAARQRVANHPLVAAAIRELGAELREVRLPT